MSAPTPRARRGPPCALRRTWRLALAALTLAAPLAHADPALDEAEVQRRLDRGSVFIQQDNCAAAVREFEVIDPYFRAHGDLPAFRWNYARCLASVQRPADALESFELMLASKLPDATREAVQAEITRLRTRVLADVTVTCAPAGSTVEIDDVTAVPLPCPARIERFPAGSRTFRVLSPDDVATVHRERIAAGTATEVRITVQPELVVRSPVAGAYVQVDGRYAGEASHGAPLVRRDFAAGEHEVRVTSPAGGQPWVRRTRLAVGQRTVVSAVVDGKRFVGPDDRIAEAGDDDDDTLLWVGIGVGAAVVAGAAITAAILLTADAPEQREGIRVTIE